MTEFYFKNLNKINCSFNRNEFEFKLNDSQKC